MIIGEFQLFDTIFSVKGNLEINYFAYTKEDESIARNLMDVFEFRTDNKNQYIKQNIIFNIIPVKGNDNVIKKLLNIRAEE